MAEKLIKLRVTRGVIVDGKPAKVGDVISVGYETAIAIARSTELFTTPEAETVQHDDPESESRDPKPFRKR